MTIGTKVVLKLDGNGYDGTISAVIPAAGWKGGSIGQTRFVVKLDDPAAFGCNEYDAHASQIEAQSDANAMLRGVCVPTPRAADCCRNCLPGECELCDEIGE